MKKLFLTYGGKAAACRTFKFLDFSYVLNIRPSESDVEGKPASKVEAFDPREFIEPVRAYMLPAKGFVTTP